MNRIKEAREHFDKSYASRGAESHAHLQDAVVCILEHLDAYDRREEGRGGVTDEADERAHCLVSTWQHAWALEESLEEQERADLVTRIASTLRSAGREDSELKPDQWWDYEQNYILPCFKWAEARGVDLPTLVRKGNAVSIFVQALTQQAQDAESALRTAEHAHHGTREELELVRRELEKATSKVAWLERDLAAAYANRSQEVAEQVESQAREIEDAMKLDLPPAEGSET